MPAALRRRFPRTAASRPYCTILTPLPYGPGQLGDADLKVAQSYPRPSVSKHGGSDNQDPEASVGKARNGEGLAQLLWRDYSCAPRNGGAAGLLGGVAACR